MVISRGELIVRDRAVDDLRLSEREWVVRTGDIGSSVDLSAAVAASARWATIIDVVAPAAVRSSRCWRSDCGGTAGGEVGCSD